MSLRLRIFLAFSLGVIFFAAMLFIPAGTLKFWPGWVFMAVLFMPAISFYLYFAKHDPQLIERRLQSKEKTSEQQRLRRFGKPVVFAALLLPGLDYRLGWSRTYLGAVPLWLMLISQAMVLGSILLVTWIINVNRFASRTIQVEAGQRVISTGPYAIVRHPMYFAFVVMGLFTPLALGSYFALPAFGLSIPFYVYRLLHEEKVLRRELPGYSEYCLRTRFRLVPFVW
jgi:protein-S-isoprenylcysteine O-methyltransferase Ste14